MFISLPASERCTSESHGHFLPWIPDCASELFTFLQAAFSAELLNPTLCQEGLVVEMSGGCTLWGLSSVSGASGKVSLVSSSWLGCCAGKMCGFGSCDVSMCSQHKAFKNGLLYFFHFLLQERRHLSLHPISPSSFLAPDYFCVCYLAWPGKEWTWKLELQSAMRAGLSRWQSGLLLLVISIKV